MRQPDLDTLLEQAIALAQAGQHAEARPLLERVIAEDPQQELAWIWLAAIARHREERLTFLRRALTLNPSNPTAQRAYQQLTGQPYATPAGGRTVSQGPTRSDMSLILLALALVVIAVVVVASYVTGGDDDEPAAAQASPTLAEGEVAATDTPSPSWTPSREPLPTHTPGPSPTHVWEAPPATWTPEPTETSVPTRTPAPTWTPRPTRTPSPIPSPLPTRSDSAG
jgi:hypothetical protein